MRFRLSTFIFVSICIVLTTCTPASSDHPAWEEHFTSRNVRGCITLYDTRSQKKHHYNADHCRQGYLPASTFKVMNALIALDTGVAESADFKIAWDGVRREYEAWNRDHTLHTAMRDSTVWYYQEIARRIGEERMLEHLRRAKYGNDALRAGIDQFWLRGDFRISPEEQLDFLRKLRRGTLPFSERSQAIVREMMIVEQDGDRTWHAKTGLTKQDGGWIGWWVGWVETKSGAVLFALNIAAPVEAVEFEKFAAARKDITRAILKDVLSVR